MVEDTPTTWYAVLGVSRGATETEIKRAYRHRAKAAHPDAGGSVTAMARVNEAYRVLGDSTARRAYDAANAADSVAGSAAHSRRSTAPSQSESRHESRPFSNERPTPYSVAEDESGYAYEAARNQRHRRAWARHSAWELLKFSMPATLAAILISRFTSSYITSSQGLLLLGFVTFIPIYVLILSIIFLADPPLRLVFADLVRRHPTTEHERLTALALVISYVPLALFWSVAQRLF